MRGKELPEEFQYSQINLESLINNISGIVYRCYNDQQWTMMFISLGCEDLIGYLAEDLINNRKISLNEIIDPDYRQEVWEKIQFALNHQQKFELIYPVNTLAGERKWVLEKGQGIFSDEGNLLFLEGLIVDISEQKKAEEKLAKINLELQQKINQYKTEVSATKEELEILSYSICHDLSAFLRRIQGFSQAIYNNYHQIIDTKGKHYLKRIQSNCYKMEELIENLLTLSKVTSTKIELSKIDLTAIASEITTDLTTSQPERNVKFIIAPNILVQGDLQLLKTVLENLFNNAWKYTSKCSFTEIEFGVIPQSKEKGIYFVRDNGVGFDMSYSDKLFIPFQRLHSETDFPGNGIGLTIVQRIIHRHGGEIWAESFPNGGCTIYFTFS